CDVCSIFFFFQAEDGIRDRNVTGVQTCALPISPLINLSILLAGYGSVGMVIGMVTINIILEVIIFIYCILKMEMHFLFKDFDRHLMLEMTIFSSYIFVNMVVEQINNNVDKTI